MIKKISVILALTGVINTNSALSTPPSKVNEPIKPKASASYMEIDGLKELKAKSDIIVEVEGTDKFELIDYKGIKMRKTTVKILDVMKGNPTLKEITVVQTEGLESEEPPMKNEKLLMFLRKGIDITDSYVPIGGNQGIYKIITKKTKKNSMTPKKLPHLNAPKDDAIKIVTPTSLINNKILRDLNGNYDDIKKKLIE
ncbi:hypothetical protein K144313037_13150 [Clostridium tetani]|uniref:Uncharacterized protein n=1 Tax=Clostridium tetani (strain Massachusetts / E88) TaxID=212717 RepID=Q894Q9_CLOTE|nr:hypothetical protein [Clostridium tetani]CDI49634.1 hypothetical protein BN906_01637 [Clostridium tetani 12124569]AAO36033.1 hypothetical protein CTC_01476 [Clostridium tetani E88]AVP55749.1 hypothetical protein C3B72_11625 [Clostridium tetani]KGI38015.1 hypothetical protein KY52_10895 [Clostridium tetani]KGI43106.1 hypothetical protein KY54_10750 [Clostridium tetani]